MVLTIERYNWTVQLNGTIEREEVRKAEKAIGRHTKKQIKLCEYSY